MVEEDGNDCNEPIGLGATVEDLVAAAETRPRNIPNKWRMFVNRMSNAILTPNVPKQDLVQEGYLAYLLNQEHHPRLIRKAIRRMMVRLANSYD
jgi:hypothetical protein